MEILLVLLIPVVIAIISFILSRSISLGEFAAHITIQLFVAAISMGVLTCANVTYKEVWNGQVIKKTKERVHCRHSYPCNPHPCMCDDKGNCSTCWDRCYEHSYDIDWDVHDNTGNIWTINTVDRQGLIQPLRWTTVEKGDPTSHIHYYKDYLKASKTTIYKSEGAEEYIKKYEKILPRYPIQIYDYYNLNRILTVGIKIENHKEYSKLLSELNGRIGRIKQCNVIIVIVNDKPKEFFYALAQQWAGANKNDIVLVISVDNNEIMWANVMALSNSNIFQVKLRDEIESLKTLDMDQVLISTEDSIKKYYTRKRMREFKYLLAEIQPEIWQIVVTMIIGICISLGLSFWFHSEEIL